MDLADLDNGDTCFLNIHNTDIDNQQPIDNDGCTDICNPFMTCSTCLGCTLPMVVFFSEQLEIIETQHTFFKDSNSRQYSGSIWQPPKIV